MAKAKGWIKFAVKRKRETFEVIIEMVMERDSQFQDVIMKEMKKSPRV
jgi:hypothetical protein